MSFLDKQTAEFKSQVASQPVFPRAKISTAVSSSSSFGGVPTKRARVEDVSGVSAGGSKKKRTAQPVYAPTPTATSVPKHTNSKLHSVINFLKEHVDEPQTYDDFRAASIDVEQDSELLRLMQKSEKILYNPKNRTFQYKPEFQIRDKEDLVKLLYERKDSKPCGLQFKDLADSYIDLKKAIDELETEKRILVIRSVKDNAPRIIFWNSTEEDTPMDKEFVDIFHKVKVPDVQVDLPKELQKAGLQKMEVYENKTKNENKQKQRKKKQVNRKIKIHNTHVAIDLTKDYVPHHS
ncbi:3041_t:CDS:2 [Ambispora leptoticha]|uniref:Transcription initiation factor IIE subunit beta n=1 Tax=Ambispora leptoticha TaxID=144679 RepID=A0A9N8WLX1_9GLOM|nr:3041_t:CDS:2 [Ambispora leptoticha]